MLACWLVFWMTVACFPMKIICICMAIKLRNALTVLVAPSLCQHHNPDDHVIIDGGREGKFSPGAKSPSPSSIHLSLPPFLPRLRRLFDPPMMLCRWPMLTLAIALWLLSTSIDAITPTLALLVFFPNIDTRRGLISYSDFSSFLQFGCCLIASATADKIIDLSCLFESPFESPAL